MTAQTTRRRKFRLAMILLSGSALAGVPLVGAAYADDTWTGATSTDWFTASNWSGNAVPTLGDGAIFSTVSPNPTVLAGGNGFAEDLFVGETTPGSLTISGGGTLTTLTNTFAYVGESGGTGTILVTGAGSSLTVPGGTMNVGFEGNGTLAVASGGAASVGGLLIGAISGSGTVTVDGPGSLLTTGYLSLIAGPLSGPTTGSLSVTNGGHVIDTTDASIGADAGQATVTVDGANSLVQVGGVTQIGQYTNGTSATVSILHGASFTSVGEIDIGGTGGASAVSAVGTVLVDGAGSQMDSAADIVVGYYGIGTLTVQNSGQVDAGSVLVAAAAAGSSGTIIITGAGSNALTQGVAVGLSGTGSISVLNGASLSGTVFNLGLLGGAVGTGLVDGAGSIMALSDHVYIAGGGTGTLTVSGGGTFNTTNEVRLGLLAGGNGTVTVTGAGSSLSSGGNFTVGDVSTGTLNVQAGGTVFTNGIDLGETTTGNGTAIVDGVGSIMTAINGIDVGTAGTGALTVRNGGQASADTLTVADSGTGSLLVSGGGTINDNTMATIGLAAGTTGTVTVDGAGSLWTNGGSLLIGGSGNGTLSISNGGSVSAAHAELGQYAGSAGSATVDGAGSTWTNVTELDVGFSGNGTLQVTNGGSVSSADIYVGLAPGITGTVLVDGAGSSLAASNSLTVGYIGNSTLTIGDGGVVSATAGTTIALQAGSVGEIDIGSHYPAAPAAPGTLDTPVVTFGAGDGAIIFNHTATNYVFAPVLAGQGTLITAAGTTILTADSSGFTGGVNVAGGTLLVNGILGGVGAAVQPGGTLGGSGTLMGEALIADGGTLKGVEGQTLTIGQSVLLSNASIVDATLGAPGGAGLFQVGQNLTLDGVLNITAAPGFNAGIYRLFDYGGALTDNGLDVGTTPSGTDATDFTVQTSVAGQVNLVDAHQGVLSFWDGAASGNANNGMVDGGTGVWSATAPNWTDANGNTNGAMLPQPGFAVFEGAAGTVTVDASAGAITVNGMQFASNGYVVSGDPIGLAAAQTVVRVGDGTAAGAGYTATIASALTGTGTLTKEDLGTLVLTGTNTYSGGTIIAAGTLQLGNGGTTGAITGDITDNATLVFDRSDAVDFKNAIYSNNGIVVQAGTGTTTLDHNNTYGGQTIITGGTLVGTVLSFGSSSILDNAALVINQATDASFGNTIAGTGSFTKQGAGSLNLTGVNGLTGATTVAAGRLAVNGALAGSTVTVQNGATLGGNGTVGGIVAQAGSNVGPGNSIGTLTVTGNYSAAAGSVYQVELDSAGHVDRINVGGSATIASGAVINVTKTDAPPYVLGTQYTVLTAASVSGTYTVTGDTAAGLFTGMNVTTDAHDVYLTYGKSKSFASVGLTPNEIATGGAADTLPNGNALAGALIGQQTVSAANNAFDQLSGDIHASIKSAAIEDSRFVREAAIGRLNTAQTDGPFVWGQGFGSWGSADSDGNAAGLSRSTAGFLGGWDAPVFETWRVGFLGGFSHTNLNAAARGAAGDSDNYHLGVYGGTQTGNFDLKAGAAYSWNNVQTRRAVVFQGYSDQLAGIYSSGTTQVFGDLGYKVDAQGVILEPFVNAAFVGLGTGALHESGGDSALSAAGDHTDVTFTTLGLRGSQDINLRGLTLTARGSVGWRRAFGDTTPLSNFAFAGSQAFTIAGVPIARDAAAVEAGFDAAVMDHLTLGISYTGQIANRAQDNGVKANVSWKF